MVEPEVDSTIQAKKVDKRDAEEVIQAQAIEPPISAMPQPPPLSASARYVLFRACSQLIGWWASLAGRFHPYPLSPFMLRTALFISGLVGLLATATVAAPTENTSSTWRPRGLRRHRAAQGDYVPVYASYRQRAWRQGGLFSFLHRGKSTARHHGGRHAHKRTTGLF